MKSLRGFSLIELLVALAIGLILVLAVTIVIARSSASQRELALANRQIENGRYAIQKITDEVHNAGFFGTLAATPEPSALPGICGVTAADYDKSLAPGIFVFSPADFLSACGLVAVDGTDVLMVIRSDSNVFNWPELDATKKPTDGNLYVQSNGVSLVVGLKSAAFNLQQRVCPLSAGVRLTTCLESAKVAADADIRRLHVTIFFISPCGRAKTGGYGGICDAQADDGQPVPTLKRYDLENGAWAVRPVAEGIENLQVELGLDNVGTIDGAPDGTFLAATPTLEQLKSVVAAGIHLLAVNTDTVAAHVDAKTYLLGSTVVDPKNDRFKRHVFSRTVRLNNSAGRREP